MMLNYLCIYSSSIGLISLTLIPKIEQYGLTSLNRLKIKLRQRHDDVQINAQRSNITWKIATPERKKSPVEAAIVETKTQKRTQSDSQQAERF